MNPGIVIAVVLCAVLAVFPMVAEAASGGGGERVNLPGPDKNGGKPLMQALALRASNRGMSEQPVSDQDVSNILWAAWGVNRSDGRRTVPTARNTQAAALFVVKADGVWRYEAEKHELVKVLGEDMRSKFTNAPMTLIYAAEEGPYAGMHVGSMYQNVGLYCASAGLANVVKGTGVNALQGKLPLPPKYSILIIQSVGLPE